MKRLASKIFITILFISNVSHIFANPVAQRYFNELYFNSEGWKLELCLGYPDSMSLENYFLVSGTDTAYFKNKICLYDSNILVLTADSLVGYLNLNQAGDTLELFYSSGLRLDFLYFGTSWQAAPLLNQSLCRYENTYNFYLDDSPTIGFPNDSIGATGCVYGYVKDLSDNPVPNIEVIYDDYSMFGKRIYTDSSGHFYLSGAFAKNTQFYVGHITLPGIYTYINVYPGKLTSFELKLNWIVTSVKNEPGHLKNYTLNQSYPNPFNPKTTISFFIPSDGEVELKVYDNLGNEIRTLISDFLTAGEYKIEFDGNKLSSGNYFYRLKTAGFIETKKFMLVK